MPVPAARGGRRAAGRAGATDRRRGGAAPASRKAWRRAATIGRAAYGGTRKDSKPTRARPRSTYPRTQTGAARERGEGIGTALDVEGGPFYRHSRANLPFPT